MLNANVIDIKESAEKREALEKTLKFLDQSIDLELSGSRIMVLPIREEYKGSLILPEETIKNMQTTQLLVARVVKVGPGSWESGVFVATTYKEGDTVLVFPTKYEADLTLNGVEYLIYQERVIIGAFPKGNVSTKYIGGVDPYKENLKPSDIILTPVKE
ncbi:MAG: co-chaperone GroES family protein [Candidatus Roizmanbacteria bacterium]